MARRPLELPFERAVAALARRPGFWWLDSARPDGRLGCFSFAGCAPSATLRVRAGRAHLEGPEAPAAARVLARAAGGAGPLAALRALRPPPPADAEDLAGWPFLGGLVGAFGYELGAALDPVPVAAGVGEDAPELVFHRADALVAHDHARDRTLALALGTGEDLASARTAAAARLRALVGDVGVGADWPRAAAPSAGGPALDAVPGL
ncbi:MAG: hypothetical protein R3263_11310, partial [Myxococcota bacterium]|nr:hypothetical protein [Myxococcota bacterium]